MRVYNIHEAKTHLSRLIEMAARGEPFIIAKSGKPMVKATSVTDREPPKMVRIGFLKGEIVLPPDFDRMGSQEIEAMFGAGD